MKTLIVLLALSVPALAQKSAKLGLALDAGSRAFDVYSTQRMLANGWHEKLLPTAIAERPAAMSAVEAANMGAMYLLSKELNRHGHHKLAKLAPYIDFSMDAPFAVHNMFLPKQAPIKIHLRPLR